MDSNNPWSDITDPRNGPSPLVEIEKNPPFNDLYKWTDIDLDIDPESKCEIRANAEQVVVRETRDDGTDIRYRFGREGIQTIVEWLSERNAGVFQALRSGDITESEARERMGDDWQDWMLLAETEDILDAQPEPDVADEEAYYDDEPDSLFGVYKALNPEEPSYDLDDIPDKIRGWVRDANDDELDALYWAIRHEEDRRAHPDYDDKFSEHED